MHARELIELAAVVARHGRALIEGDGARDDRATESYWVASKCRLERWGRTLKHLSGDAAVAEGRRAARGLLAGGVMEEILTGEVLTRVWTAVACGCDRRRGTDRMEPIARSVLIGHLEARHRVLTLLVRGPVVGAELAVKLNRLRRRTERWTDLLVGYLGQWEDVCHVAIDPRRAAEFAGDLREQGRRPGGRAVWPLVQASLRAGFWRGLAAVSPNADLNARIGAAVLAAFPPELFDSVGLVRSVWQLRLSNAADDAAGMLAELTDAGDRSPAESALDRQIRRLGNRARWFGG